jgi:hypothetical protein
MKFIKTLPILLILAACNFPGAPVAPTPRPLPETPNCPAHLPAKWGRRP